MITKDKVIEFFCIIDEFDKNLNAELTYLNNKKLGPQPIVGCNKKKGQSKKHRLSWTKMEKMYYLCTQF